MAISFVDGNGNPNKIENCSLLKWNGMPIGVIKLWGVRAPLSLNYFFQIVTSTNVKMKVNQNLWKFIAMMQLETLNVLSEKRCQKACCLEWEVLIIVMVLTILYVFSKAWVALKSNRWCYLFLKRCFYMSQVLYLHNKYIKTHPYNLVS